MSECGCSTCDRHEQMSKSAKTPEEQMRRELIETRNELAKVRAQAAEMGSALKMVLDARGVMANALVFHKDISDRIKHALSADADKGWVPPEVYAEVCEAALQLAAGKIPKRLVCPECKQLDEILYEANSCQDATATLHALQKRVVETSPWVEGRCIWCHNVTHHAYPRCTFIDCVKAENERKKEKAAVS